MSNSILNDSLATNPWVPYIRTPVNNVSVNGNPNGKTWAYRNSVHDLLSFQVSVRDYTETEADTVRDFVRSHYGAYDTFLWKDIRNFTVATYTAIASWTAEDDFQLLDTVGSETFNRYNIVSASEVIKYDGVTKVKDTDYSIDYTDDGSIVFIIDPAGGEAVTASFQFYRRCRFDAVMSERQVGDNLVDMTLRFTETVPDGV